MTSITTRETAGGGATVKDAPLTNAEIDNNFISITTSKLEASNNLSDLTDTAAAKSNLDLASMGEQESNNVSITGGSITGITDLDVSDGGTGASTASGARTNLGLEIGTDIQDQLQIVNENTSSSTFYPLFVESTTGSLSQTVNVSDTKLFYQASTGTLNATTFNSLSDATAKININEITNGLDTVNSISGFEFNWKDSNDHSSGVVAQEIEKVLPHLVVTSNNGMKSVNYAGLTAYLISAIKELNLKIK